MEIEEIYKPYIYSIKYEGQELSEFDRLFDAWNDITEVVEFMRTHQEYLNNPIWGERYTPESAARKVRDEAIELEDLFEDLYENTNHGETPDYDSHFKFLDGKYMVYEYIPMKSYGPGRPSFLRMYAIKLKNNLYVITGGGIKLADKIQNSPDLKDHVIKNIDNVRAWLKDSGIIDEQDI